jgi:16S rRNA (guanine527-N7)-methyltransferase
VRLLEGARSLGLTLVPDQAQLLRAYSDLLITWNARLNLTRISPEDFITLHYLDSLAVLTAVSPARGARLLDVGTGAGIPGLVLKVARPDLRVTLLDSTRKKLDFVRTAAETLGLSGVDCIHGRAEDLAGDSRHAGRYDLVTARAVAPTEKLVGWVMPFVAAKGRAVLLKGARAHAELEAAQSAIRRAGARIESVREVELPGGPARSLVVLVPSAASAVRGRRRGPGAS